MRQLPNVAVTILAVIAAFLLGAPQVQSHTARDSTSWLTELHNLAVLDYAPSHQNRLPHTMLELVPLMSVASEKQYLINDFLYNEACAGKQLDKLTPPHTWVIFIDKTSFNGRYKVCWEDGLLALVTPEKLAAMRNRLGDNVNTWLASQK
jgi:hypothetical protein